MNVLELETLQSRGVRLLVAGGWVYALVLALITMVRRDADTVVMLTAAAAINALPSIMAWQGRGDLTARILVAIMAAVQPVLLVYALRGDAWQMDMHMYFFVNLAALTVLCDWRPIAIAAAVIAVHHLLFELIAPEWVFNGAGNLARVLTHACAVILQLATLSYVTIRLRAMLVNHAEARSQSEALALEAGAAREHAEEESRRSDHALAALQAAERMAKQERTARQVIERQADERRRRDQAALSRQFEESVAVVVTAVGSAAGQLESLARDLNTLASDTGRQATAVASTASQATENARKVAAGVSNLSQSLANIAANVGDQAEKGVIAQSNSMASDEAIRSLAQHATNIGSFVDLIQNIASRTNLLALNAEIEAARAGDAGRGFSVVASEVKSLASQTADATNKVTGLIVDVQNSASLAGGSLVDVTGAVHDLAQAAESIAATTAEQRKSAVIITASAAETASSADDMANQIGRVADAAKAADQLSNAVQSAAHDLLNSAEMLQSVTQQFVEQLKAA